MEFQPNAGQPATSGPVQPGASAWPGPVGRPPRAHWWSIQSPPPVERISARRAYLEVLGVYLTFFAASIVAGGETLARRYPVPSGSWAVFTPAAISELALCALAILVAGLLSARRGISLRMLGFGLPRKASGKVAAAQAYRIGAWALVALIIGGFVTGALATGKLGQPAHQDASYLLYTTAASLAAGIVEETIALAFVVSTLRQAGRPLPEIVLVAVVLRCCYHDYYGPGVVGIAIWAAIYVWLYLRGGSIVPLIVVHFLWDVTIFWGQQPHWRHAFTIGRADAYFVLPAVAGITWLVDVIARASRHDPTGISQPAGGQAWPPQ